MLLALRSLYEVSGYSVGHIFIEPILLKFKKFKIDVIARSLSIHPGDLLIETNGGKIYVLIKDPLILRLN